MGKVLSVRFKSQKSNSGQNEIGWISTTDLFIFSSCFLLLLSISQVRKSEGLNANADSLGKQVELLEKEVQTVSEQLRQAENSRSAADQKLKSSERNLAVEKEKSIALAKEQQASREQMISQQKSLNNKLVGLGGKLENVALIVDISSSMRVAKTRSGGSIDNWQPTLDVIERWVDSLDVKAAALIFFGESAELKMGMKKLNSDTRREIVEILKSADPRDKATNFLAAFELAYKLGNVDTIIIFSDGLPSVDINGNWITPGRSDGESSSEEVNTLEANIERVLAVHTRLLELSRQQPQIVINAIGLGDKVYTKHTGNLLNELALSSGGIFLALPSRVDSE
jgi:hypothetical protein